MLKDPTKKKKKTDKENKSYLTLQEGVEDPPMKAKFKFFEMLARHFTSFLVDYQTYYLMVPVIF